MDYEMIVFRKILKFYFIYLWIIPNTNNDAYNAKFYDIFKNTCFIEHLRTNGYGKRTFLGGSFCVS